LTFFSGATDVGYTMIKQGDENALKAAVATIGPIAVAIDAEDDFVSYTSGVFESTNCSQTDLDHGVLVVGYGTDKESGKDYWLVKNSWAADWGDEGYIKMARNKNNMCGIASFALYPNV
jgi:cathepsin L